MGAAFPTPAEADLVDWLRRDGDAVFSLVAVKGNAVVGHMALSKVAAPFLALGLGPVAVLPERQRTGIGTRMIREGLLRAKRAGKVSLFSVNPPLTDDSALMPA